jgi:alkylation response protein AidB-like acyl-CoA dehydrogenase
MRYLAVSVAAFVFSGLVAPTLALGQQPTPKPNLTATPGSVFPDRTYMLQLPSHAAMPKAFLTENGIPVTNLAISARGGSAIGTYVISYRSLLPPQVKAVVRARITGFPAATTTYTTPALNVTASENFERRWRDSRYVTIFVIVAVLALMAFAVLGRLKHRD